MESGSINPEKFIEIIKKIGLHDDENVIHIDIDHFLNCDTKTIEEILKRKLFLMAKKHKTILAYQLEPLSKPERNIIIQVINSYRYNQRYINLSKYIRSYVNAYNKSLSMQEDFDIIIEKIKKILDDMKIKELEATQNTLHIISNHIHTRSTLYNTNNNLEQEIQELKQEIDKENSEVVEQEAIANEQIAKLLHENKILRQKSRVYEKGIKASSSFDAKYKMCVKNVNELQDTAKNLSLTREQISNEYFHLKDTRKQEMTNKVAELQEKIKQNISILEEERNSGESAKLIGLLTEERKRKDEKISQAKSLQDSIKINMTGN